MLNTEIILKLIREQIANPARAAVNSEAAFVSSNLKRAGFQNEGIEYWHWAVNPSSRPSTKPDNAPTWVTDEIHEANLMLTQITKTQTIPDWGRSGT